MNDEKKDEGVRSAAVLLTQVDDGALNAELSEAIHKTVNQLYEMAHQQAKDAKGEVTLKFGLSVSEKGFVAVRGTVDTKVPKAKGAAGHFWITPGGNLTLENPRQQKLGFRDVSGPKTAIDVPPAATAARDV